MNQRAISIIVPNEYLWIFLIFAILNIKIVLGYNNNFQLE